jgi:hypothetical protein
VGLMVVVAQPLWRVYSSGQPKPASFIVAEQLVEIVQLLQIIFSFERGVNDTFFGIFS